MLPDDSISKLEAKHPPSYGMVLLMASGGHIYYISDIQVQCYYLLESVFAYDGTQASWVGEMWNVRNMSKDNWKKLKRGVKRLTFVTKLNEI